jgi:YhcH/YjgK/YiaL family protein
MIADRLEHLERYRGLDPRLDRGLEALRRLAGGPPAADGRHELEGADLYASFSSYETASPLEKPFEVHRRYIDIQAVLAGRELLYWAPLAGLAAHQAYSEAEDVAFFEDPAGGGAGLLLDPGSFVVLFPQDAHKPGCRVAGGSGGTGGAGQVRKLVLKVRV